MCRRLAGCTRPAFEGLPQIGDSGRSETPCRRVSAMAEDWRLHVRLGEHHHAIEVTERLQARELEHDVMERIGGAGGGGPAGPAPVPSPPTPAARRAGR